MLANHVFWRLMLFYTLLLKPSVMWLSIATFNNDVKPPPKWILREFDASNPTQARRVTPPWNVYMATFDPGWEGNPVWETGLPALTGHPTYHVNVTKLQWEIIWIHGLPHLSGLPHLPGVPHLHVNRPSVAETKWSGQQPSQAESRRPTTVRKAKNSYQKVLIR